MRVRTGLGRVLATYIAGGLPYPGYPMNGSQRIVPPILLTPLKQVQQIDYVGYALLLIEEEVFRLLDKSAGLPVGHLYDQGRVKPVTLLST